MHRPPLQDWTFRAPLPHQGPLGWLFVVEGLERQEFGPFPDSADAWAARERLFRTWCRAARERGGWAWRPNAVTWAVTLPKGAVVAGLPLQHAPCTRASG
jgi:hypothetical protein